MCPPSLEAVYCIRVLKMTIGTLSEGFANTLIHLSDRGTKYASAEYIKALTASNIVPSITEGGNPKGNAMSVRINNSIKNEPLHGQTFTNIKQVAAAVRKAVDFYNGGCPHSSINMFAPDQTHRMKGKVKKTLASVP